MRSSSRILFAALLIPSAAAAQSVAWVQVATTGPASRYGHGMAFDVARNRTVLFGGYTNSTGVSGETWEWNGNTWSQRVVPGPSARGEVAMAYDSARQRIVLFGGHDGTERADTWEWDGTAWVPQVLAMGPGPRSRHAMAYDSARGRVVMFGGYRSAGGNQWLGDTWEWDGTTWFAVSVSGPSGRSEHAMAFDSLRGRTVLFGGQNSPGGIILSFLEDTWEWNGTAWTQVAATGPVRRSAHAMVYDTQHNRVLMTGGENDASPGPSGLWEWNGLQWAQLGPGQNRQGLAMAYDSHRGRAVLFGGIPYNANTWELVSTGANATPYGSGCGAPPLALSAVPNALPSLGAIAQATVANAPTPFAFVALGVSNTTFGPFSLPVSLASIGMPGCSLLHSANVTGEPTTATGPGTASYSFAIPNNPALIGFHVYLQAWSWAPGANPANVIVSNGLDWQVGN